MRCNGRTHLALYHRQACDPRFACTALVLLSACGATAGMACVLAYSTPYLSRFILPIGPPYSSARCAARATLVESLPLNRFGTSVGTRHGYRPPSGDTLPRV